MVQLLVSGFVQAVFLAAVALLVGRFAGREAKRMPEGVLSKAGVFLQVWAVTFIAQAAGFYAGGWLGASGDTLQVGLGFLLPIAIGALYAHMLLKPRAAR